MPYGAWGLASAPLSGRAVPAPPGDPTRGTGLPPGLSTRGPPIRLGSNRVPIHERPAATVYLAAKQPPKLVHWNRTRRVISLSVVDAHLLQARQLCRGLNSFRDDAHVELMRHAHEHLDNDARGRVGLEPVDKQLVDLQNVGAQPGCN